MMYQTKYSGITRLGLILVGQLFIGAAQAVVPTLDENCVINILNRTIQVSPDGTWALPNVPSTMGSIRARATCVVNGETFSGQTDYFNVAENATVNVGKVYFDVITPPPSRLEFTHSGGTLIQGTGTILSLSILAHYPDGSSVDVTASNGINYLSSNPAIASIDSVGNITAVSTGSVLVTVRMDGAVVIARFSVITSGDTDGDGIPDDFELANGLDASDPVDAVEDMDRDGLSNLDEFNLGTDINNADTDGDGINDYEETVAGSDGFITNPLLLDTDNDGLSDGIEVMVGSSPLDGNDANFEDAVVALTVIPEEVILAFNAIDTEATAQLTVTGEMIDGSQMDLTSKDFGTGYSSSDLTIINFGLEDGLLFGGQSGNAMVTVTNGLHQVEVPVTVDQFIGTGISTYQTQAGNSLTTNVEVSGNYLYLPNAQSGIEIVDISDRTAPVLASLFDTAYARAISVVGDTVYVADGPAGLKIIDVTDRTAPVLLSSLYTGGDAVALASDGDTVYLAKSREGLDIIDVTDPTAPRVLKNIATISKISGVDLDVARNRIAMIDGNRLVMVDVSDRESPVELGRVFVTNGMRNRVLLHGDYAYMTTFYLHVVNVSDPTAPVVVPVDYQGGEVRPTDVAASGDFLFTSDVIFVGNFVPYFNNTNPDAPFYQGALDLNNILTSGNGDTEAIAADAAYTYTVNTGGTKVFIGQHRALNDNFGIAPTVKLVSPANGSSVVENERITITADADDDVVVARVDFMINGAPVCSDTATPFQCVINAPINGAQFITVDVKAVDLGGNESAVDSVLYTVMSDEDLDGLSDEAEWAWSPIATDYLNPDSDGDTLLDGFEAKRGLDPMSKDSDGDGIDDNVELANGTDPLNADITPPVVVSSSPAPGEVGIPEMSPISVLFNESLRAISVNSTTFKMRKYGFVEEVSGTYQLLNNNREVVFYPDALMADMTEYEVIIEGVKDSAGNALLGQHQFVFTTGNTADVVAPKVVYTSPRNKEMNVGLNSHVVIVMDEPVTVESIEVNLELRDHTSGGTTVETMLLASDDRKTFRLIPARPLQMGHLYYVVMSAGVADLFGNQTTRLWSSLEFTAAFIEDLQAPTVVGSSVADGEVNVPLNADLSARFSESISVMNLDGIKLLNQAGETVSTFFEINIDRTLVTLQPKALLEANAIYRMVFEGVRDPADNLLQSDFAINFTTGSTEDTVAPKIQQWGFPTTNVPLNPNLEVIFSEAINLAYVHGGNVYLKNNTEGKVVPSEVVVSEDRRSLRLQLNEPLKANFQYIMYVGFGERVMDTARNSLYSSRTFTTGLNEDYAAPEVSVISIDQEAVEIALNSKLVIDFNEPLSLSCFDRANVTVTADGGGVIPATVVLSTDGQRLTVTPQGMLANTRYTLTINGLCDYSGNNLAAISQSYTTRIDGTNDTAGPLLVSIAPAKNAVGVDVNSAVVLVFNEPVAGNSRPIISINGVANTNLQGSYVIAGDTITFTPDAPLLGNTKYKVDFSAKVWDLAGNTRSATIAYFTTADAGVDADAPGVAVVSPANNDSNVSPLTDVVVSFDEPMDKATLLSSNIRLFANGSLINSAHAYSVDGMRLTINPSANLPEGSVVSLVMTEGVTDLSGNALPPYVSSFTTAVLDKDATSPSVSRQLPAVGATGVPADSEIVLYASEPLNAGSVVNSVYVTENDNPVTGLVEVMGDNRTIRFVKDTPFAEGALIHVYVDSTATDVSGNPVDFYRGHFTVEDNDPLIGVAPRWSGRYPDAPTEWPLNPVFYIAFNEEMDAQALAQATVELNDQTHGGMVALERRLHSNGRVVILSLPEGELLLPGTRYYLRYNNLVDSDGDIFTLSGSSSFTTSAAGWIDNVAPEVVLMSPPNGETDVSLNPRYAVRFSESVNPLIFDDGTGDQVHMSFNGDGTEVVYERLNALPVNSEVTEFVPANTVDIAGNALVSTSSTFITGDGPDFTAPTVSTPIKANDTLAVNPVLEWNYSEPLDPTSVSDATVFLNNQSGVKMPVDLVIDNGGKRVVVTPLSALSEQRYSLYSRAVTDMSGNTAKSVGVSFYIAGGADLNPPMVVQSSVEDGYIDVPTNVRLSVQFNEILNALRLDQVQLLDGNLQPHPIEVTLSADRQQMSINLKQLLVANTHYTLLLAGIVDISGNEMPATTIQFTTGAGGDLTGTVAADIVLSLDGGEASISAMPELTATLPEKVDIFTFNSSTSMRFYGYGIGYLAGSVTLEADRQTLTFHLDPSVVLQVGSKYRLSVSTGMKDLAGNTISAKTGAYTTLIE